MNLRAQRVQSGNLNRPYTPWPLEAALAWTTSGICTVATVALAAMHVGDYLPAAVMGVASLVAAYHAGFIVAEDMVRRRKRALRTAIAICRMPANCYAYRETPFEMEEAWEAGRELAKMLEEAER